MRVTNVTVDRVTLLGFMVKEKFYSLINDDINHTILKRYRANFPFDWSYNLPDNVFIQESNSIDRNNYRIEFNPNNVQEKNNFLMKYIGCMKYAKYSRVDIAIDVEDIDFNDFYIVDNLSRKRISYVSGTGALETLYIGTRSSDLMIRIYDKAKERVQAGFLEYEGKKLWRIEAQIKGDFLKLADYQVMNIPNVFENLTIGYKKSILNSDLDIREKSMLHYLTEFPNEMKTLNKRTRLKYKKMLSDLSQSDSENENTIDLAKVFKENKYQIQQKLKLYIEPTKINNKIYNFKLDN